VQPVIDKAAFSRLVAECGSSRAATSFISRFTDLLDERILAIEHAVRAPRSGAWRCAVEKLRADATTAGAARLQATAGLLLDVELPDARTALPLVGQLRSDARVFTLAHSSLSEEKAFADHLAIRRRA
jgi:hypothetical protein